LNIETAIDIIESCAGFTDESAPVGEAWLVVLRCINAAPPVEVEA